MKFTFQSLIGRLETEFSCANSEKNLRFQSLIGRLETSLRA